jgi:hypothetical protein
MRGRSAFLTGAPAVIQSANLNFWVWTLAKLDQHIARGESALLNPVRGHDVHRHVEDLAMLNHLRLRVENEIAGCQQ